MRSWRLAAGLVVGTYPKLPSIQNLPLTSTGNNGTGSPNVYELTNNSKTMAVKQNTGAGWWKAGNRTNHVAGSGKWYFESRIDSLPDVDLGYAGGVAIGLAQQDIGVDVTSGVAGSGGRYQYHGSGQKRANGFYETYGQPYVAGDVIGIGYDTSTGEIYAWKNGTALGLMYDIKAYTGGQIIALQPHICQYYVSTVTMVDTVQYLPDGYTIWA